MSRRQMFIAGVIPARKAVVSAAAQVSLHALVEDLGDPGVYRLINYNLIGFIACLETGHPDYTPDRLQALVTRYRLEGKADDAVCDLIQVYVDARRKLGE